MNNRTQPSEVEDLSWNEYEIALLKLYEARNRLVIKVGKSRPGSAMTLAVADLANTCRAIDDLEELQSDTEIVADPRNLG